MCFLQTTWRGVIFSFTHRCNSVSLVPAPALDLHIRHSDETSLSAMWSHAPSGSRDGYFLTLRHGNRTSPPLRLCLYLCAWM